MLQKRNFKVFFFSFLILASLGSCKSNKKIVGTHSLERISLNDLLKKVDANEFRTPGLSIKMNVAFKTDKLSDSFKMYARLKQDSILWLSATYYKVEVARILVTPDSVQLLDKRNKKYYVGDFRVLNENFNTDFNFYSLQDLILGNANSTTSTSKMKLSEEDEHYIMGTTKKFKKVHDIRVTQLKDNLAEKPEDEEGELVVPKSFVLDYKYFINPKRFKVDRLMVRDERHNKSIFIKYDDFREVGSGLLPHEILYNIVTNEIFKVNVTYLRSEAEDALLFPFKVTDKYERVVY